VGAMLNLLNYWEIPWERCWQSLNYCELPFSDAGEAASLYKVTNKHIILFIYIIYNRTFITTEKETLAKNN
jgi:hypothetical protein